jgi:hypothetical protein
MNQRNLGFLGLVVVATALMRTGASDVPQGGAGAPAKHDGVARGLVTVSGCPVDPDPDGPWKAAQAYFQLRNPVTRETCKPDAQHRFPCVPRDRNTRLN